MARDDAFEDLLVAGGARIDEVVLDEGKVAPRDSRAAFRIGVQRRDCICERWRIVELDDGAGVARRQEISLTAAVVADDRQAERHRFEKHEAKALVLAGGHKQIGERECGVLLFFGGLAEQMDAIFHAQRAGACADGGCVGTVADDQQVRIRNPAVRKNVRQLCRRFACNQTADRRHDESLLGQSEDCTRRCCNARWTLDAQRNQFDASLHAIDLAHVPDRVARLAYHRVGLPDHRTHGGPQHRVTMRRAALARIEQVAAVHRQNVREPTPARERSAKRTGRHDEVRVDDIEGVLEGQPANESAGQIRQHRRKVRNGQLSPEEYGCANDAHALIVAARRQIDRLGGQRSHFMAFRELPRKRSHDHAAAAAKRRIFIVAEEDLHSTDNQQVLGQRAGRRLATGKLASGQRRARFGSGQSPAASQPVAPRFGLRGTQSVRAVFT